MSFVSSHYCRFNKLTPVNYIGLVNPKGSVEVICVVDNDIEPDGKDTFGKNLRTKPGYKFALLPDLNIEDRDGVRSAFTISGCSGSGKTTLASRIAEIYAEEFPENKIIYICPKKPSESLMKLKPIIISVNGEKGIENFVNPETKLEFNEDDPDNEWSDSLVIFDDLEGCSPKVKKNALELLGNILTVGRARNVSVVYINHTYCNGNESKRVFSECPNITVFPMGKMNKQLDYLLNSYCGIDRDTKRRIMNSRSRWVNIFRHRPCHVITEDELFIY